MDLLAVIWDLDPVLLKLGPLEIRFYSLLFVAGLYPLGFWIVKQFYKREGAPLDLLEPLLYALFIGTLVGARLGHCLFYDPWYYLAQPVEILKVWEGGLASHGGAIGCVIAIYWYAKKYGKKVGFDFWWVVDRVVIATCFAAWVTSATQRFTAILPIFHGDLFSYSGVKPFQNTLHSSTRH